MKNAFDGLSGRLSLAEGTTTELDDMTVETYKTRKQRLKKKKRQNIQELWGNCKRCDINIRGISERENKKVKDAETIFQAIMMENFPKTNVGHQPTGPGSSENTNQDIMQK